MSDGAHKVKEDIEKNSWKIFFGLVKMAFGLVDVGYSLPKGQAVKLIFFAPCECYIMMQMKQRTITLSDLNWVQN